MLGEAKVVRDPLSRSFSFIVWMWNAAIEPYISPRRVGEPADGSRLRGRNVCGRHPKAEVHRGVCCQECGRPIASEVRLKHGKETREQETLVQTRLWEVPCNIWSFEPCEVVNRIEARVERSVQLRKPREMPKQGSKPVRRDLTPRPHDEAKHSSNDLAKFLVVRSKEDPLTDINPNAGYTGIRDLCCDVLLLCANNPCTSQSLVETTHSGPGKALVTLREDHHVIGCQGIRLSKVNRSVDVICKKKVLSRPVTLVKQGVFALRKSSS